MKKSAGCSGDRRNNPRIENAWRNEKDELKNENLDALKIGFANLKRHIRNMEQYQLPVIVAINEFVTDTDSELTLLEHLCEDQESLLKEQVYGQMEQKVALI
ncbi:formate--tetrahydrofolate ligase [Enterococcus lactis]|nr:formate--tetrahydrofolate ligase [Enterococcus lactis]